MHAGSVTGPGFASPRLISRAFAGRGLHLDLPRLADFINLVDLLLVVAIVGVLATSPCLRIPQLCGSGTICAGRRLHRADRMAVAQYLADHQVLSIALIDLGRGTSSIPWNPYQYLHLANIHATARRSRDDLLCDQPLL